MSRVEKFDQVTETEPAVEDDPDAPFMKLWLTAGYWAQNLTILGFLATLCGILFYHL